VVSSARRPGRKLLAGALLLGLLLSQPGHALGYLVEYGSRSFALQSQGVHAYFPTAIHLSFELLATIGVVAGAVLGLGRLAVGRALGLESERRLRAIDLILVLAIVQVNAFFFQEVTETLAAHAALDTQWLLATLVGAATGQLPIAIAAGLLLSYCAVRLRVAIQALRHAPSLVVWSPDPLQLAPVSFATSARSSFLAQACPLAFRKRGPPPFGL
jgi:hypothetical protein